MATRIKEGMTGAEVAQIIDNGFDNLEELNQRVEINETILDGLVSKENLIIPTDEEDITSESGALKFKDREYDEANFSGKGYKILRKNIQDDKNVLTLDMVNEANTVYEIRYDFDLDEAVITIQDGCILYFNGGQLSNGEIKGNLILRGHTDNTISNVKLSNDVLNSLTILNDDVYSESGANICVVHNEQELLLAVDLFNSRGSDMNLVIRGTIQTKGISITNSNNTLKIYGGKLIYSSLDLNITKSISKTTTHYCVELNSDPEVYDVVLGENTRIPFCGENTTYVMAEKMVAYNIVTNEEVENIDDIFTNENVYARAKLDSDLASKLGNINLTDAKNIWFTYTSGWRNFWVNVHHIENGYLYFKNQHVTYNSIDNFNVYINGDWNYHSKCRYRVINAKSLLSPESVCIDENNVLYVPIKENAIYYTDVGSYTLKSEGTLELYGCNFYGGYIQVHPGKITTIKDCTFNNGYSAIDFRNVAIENVLIDNNKIENMYKEGIYVSHNGSNCTISNNLIRNIGLIDYNASCAIFVACDNAYIFRNKLVNFYTGIRSGNTRNDASYNISAGIYQNELVIENGFITADNFISDLGAIYVFTHQRGTNPLGEGTIVKENIVINRSTYNVARGIYFDDGAYNSSAIANYIKGFTTGIYARTVDSVSTGNTNLNKNNHFKYNIIVEGSVNIGGREDKDSSPEIDSNILFTKEFIVCTLTNLDNVGNGLMICGLYLLLGDILYIPRAIISYLFNYSNTGNYTTKQILEYAVMRADYNNKSIEYPVNMRVPYLNDGSSTYKYLDIKIKLSPFKIENDMMYNLRLGGDYFHCYADLRVRYLDEYNKYYLDFKPISITDYINTIKYRIDEDSLTLVVRIGVDEEYAANIISNPGLWNQLLYIPGKTKVLKWGTFLLSSSDDTTDIYYVNNICPTFESLNIYLEHSNEEGEGWSTLYDFSRAVRNMTKSIYRVGKDSALLLLFPWTPNPFLLYFFDSKEDGIRSGISSFYFKEGNSVKYYNNEKVYYLDGTEVDSPE